MSTKHTPGPLTVTRDETFPFYIITKDANGEAVWIEPPYAYNSGMITLYDFHAGVGFDESERQRLIEKNERQYANALLRAAAPELLEQLSAAVEMLESIDRLFGVEGTRGLIDRTQIACMRAAITKATGAA